MNAVGIRVAGGIKPEPRLLFSVARRLEQLVEHSIDRLERVLRVGDYKILHFIGSRRKSGEIKINAAQQTVRSLFRIRLKPLGFHFG